VKEQQLFPEQKRKKIWARVGFGASLTFGLSMALVGVGWRRRSLKKSLGAR
jgi:hypothetical protein